MNRMTKPAKLKPSEAPPHTIRVRAIAAVHVEPNGEVNYDIEGWGRDGEHTDPGEVRGLVEESVRPDAIVRYTWIEAEVPAPAPIGTVKADATDLAVSLDGCAAAAEREAASQRESGNLERAERCEGQAHAWRHAARLIREGRGQ